MWIDEILNDIEKTRFSLHKLCKNPNTNEFISYIDYIDLVLDEFLSQQKQLISSLNGLDKLELLEDILFRKKNYSLYDSNLRLDYDLKLRNVILTYIYWKYRHPHYRYKASVDMMQVKKIFKIRKSYKEYITPITCTTNCYICNGKAILYIFDYSQSKLTLKCHECGHSYKIDISDTQKVGGHRNIQYSECECWACRNVSNNIKNKGIEQLNKLKDICINLIQDNNEYINLPSNLSMKKAYDFYINNTHKEIDEILKYNSISSEQLKNIIENFSDSNKILLSKLQNHGVVYKCKRKNNVNYKKLIICYLLSSKDESNYEEMFQKIYSNIFNGSFIKNLNINTHENNRYISFDLSIINKSSNYFNISSEINIEKLKEYIYEYDIYINPYFTNKHSHKENTISYKDELINQINTRIQNYPEHGLEYILTHLDSCEKYLLHKK